jgi:hypothetical protein
VLYDCGRTSGTCWSGCNVMPRLTRDGTSVVSEPLKSRIDFIRLANEASSKSSRAQIEL